MSRNYFSDGMIHTREGGIPFIRPARDEHPEGIDGTVAYWEAISAYNNAVGSCWLENFAIQFRKSIGKPVRAGRK